MKIKIETSLGEQVFNEPTYGQMEDQLDSKNDKAIFNLINDLQDTDIVLRDLPFSEVKKVISDFFTGLNQQEKI